jgi:hypothetical protein
LPVVARFSIYLRYGPSESAKADIKGWWFTLAEIPNNCELVWEPRNHEID